MRSVVISIVAVVVTLLAGCERYALDRQMEELCRKDGGNKVYETVSLSAEMFDEFGYPFPGWRDRSQERKLGDDYLYIYESEVLKDGDPFKGKGRLTRTHIKILRKADEKIMAETVAYSRVGGDGVVIGHPTSSSCPTTGGPIEKLAFVKK